MSRDTIAVAVVFTLVTYFIALAFSIAANGGDLAAIGCAIISILVVAIITGFPGFDHAVAAVGLAIGDTDGCCVIGGRLTGGGIRAIILGRAFNKIVRRNYPFSGACSGQDAQAGNGDLFDVHSLPHKIFAQRQGPVQFILRSEILGEVGVW